MLSNGKTSDNTNIWRYLTLLLPISFGIVATLESGRFFLVLGAVLGMGWGWKYYQQQQQKQQAQLTTVFYRLIQENQGRISTLDLAMDAKLPGNVVQQYLEDRASEFAADYEITEQGGIIYHFETAKPAQSQPELETAKPTQSQPELKTAKSPDLFPIKKSQKAEKLPIPLTQSELARRLKVHPSTVSKWKLKPDFTDWSSQKDPESVAWKYVAESKRFEPVNLNNEVRNPVST